MTRGEAVEYLVDLGIPVAPIYDIDEAIEDPRVKARDMIVKLDHPKAGGIVTTNFPIKFEETTVEINSAAPTLGENNQEILSKLLGYTTERIKDLREDRGNRQLLKNRITT